MYVADDVERPLIVAAWPASGVERMLQCRNPYGSKKRRSNILRNGDLSLEGREPF
jgi:hypothetical protein